MAQRTKGFFALLGRPWAYDGLQRLLYRAEADREFARVYLPPVAAPHFRILDIGCGTGAVLGMLEAHAAFEYVGIEPNPAYVAKARRTYGGRGRFVVGTTATVDRAELGVFDYAVAYGVLHHLDDAEADALLAFAAAALAAGGRFIAVDNCLFDGQHPVSRLLTRYDRGRNVRTREGYEQLARRRFAAVRTDLHDNWLRVPYHHCILVATQPRAAGRRPAAPAAGWAP